MTIYRIARFAICVSAFVVAAVAPARAEGPFSTWAAIVVAGDWRAHGGGSTEAFDNARRDVSTQLRAIGFEAANMRQFSPRAQNFPNENVAPAQSAGIRAALGDLTRTATAGCLVYFTSHGSRDGIVLGQQMLSPDDLEEMLDDTCGDRPTIVVVSACFSGVFVSELRSSTRMVLTAARPDRSSFGCGESNRYPYFDDCFLSSIGGARDFPSLGQAVQGCVAQKERDTRSSPPSEPQLSLGRTIEPLLRSYPFQRITTQVSTQPVAPSACPGRSGSGNSNSLGGSANSNSTALTPPNC